MSNIWEFYWRDGSAPPRHRSGVGVLVTSRPTGTFCTKHLFIKHGKKNEFRQIEITARSVTPAVLEAVKQRVGVCSVGMQQVCEVGQVVEQ